MSWLHRHQWRKSAATYIAPWAGPDTYIEMEYRTKYAITGVTSVLLLCSTCGEVKIAKMRGKPIDKALADLVGVEDD